MPENPEEKLKELRNQLPNVDAELGKITKQRDTLKTDISALEKITAEINQVINTYNQAFQKIKEDYKNIESYLNIKRPIIVPAIQEKKGAVDHKINEVVSQIETIEKEVESLKSELDNAKTEHQNVKENLEYKQNAYDSLKTLQKKIDDNLKELKNLKESIEKENAKNNIISMYYLISELNTLLSETNSSIVTPEKLKSALYETWGELDAAKTTLREKEERLKTAKNILESKQKDLEEKLKNRRQDILKEIANL